MQKKILYFVAIVFALIAIIYASYSYSNLPRTNSSTISHTTTAPQYSGNLPNNQIIVDLITWTDQNGYNSIQWGNITELDIFHVWVNADGSLVYDGNLSNPNVSQIIATAHENNVKVVLSVGGDGENATTIDNILANGTLRGAFVSNVVHQVSSQNYDGVKIDFEGYFNQSQFTELMRQLSVALRAKNENYIIAVNIAAWDSSSFNVTALSQYVTNFEVQFNPSLAELQNWSSQAGGRSKISAGYDLTTASNFTNLEQNLINDRKAGYGIFFYSLYEMNSTVWDYLSSAESQSG